MAARQHQHETRWIKPDWQLSRHERTQLQRQWRRQQAEFSTREMQAIFRVVGVGSVSRFFLRIEPSYRPRSIEEGFI